MSDKIKKTLSKNIKVLLINPRIKDDPPFFPPYALLWIAAYLEKNHFEVTIYDRNVDKEDLRQVLERINPDVVGISCLTGEVLLDVKRLLSITKNYNYRIKTILGGIHVFFFPKETLMEREVDFIIRGEGEETMLQLLKNLYFPENYRKIKGLGFKNQKGQIILNPPREFIKDLNSLPDPAWHLVKMEKYFNRTFYAKKVVILNTSRGCPYRCAFCFNPAYHERKYRSLTANRLIKQVMYFQKRFQVDGVQFYEDEFDADPKRVDQFCQELIKRNIKINWHMGGRVNYAGKERLKLLKQAGCRLIEFGVESGSQRMLDFLHKDIKIEQIKEAFQLAKEVGIKTYALFMIGLPTETEGELKQTLSLIESLPTFNVVCCIYKPYPGTELFNFCVKKYHLKLPKTLEEFAYAYNFDSTLLTATDIPVETLIKIRDEIVGKNILDTLKMCVKELRFGYLYSLITKKMIRARENRLFFSLVDRMKRVTGIDNIL